MKICILLGTVVLALSIRGSLSAAIPSEKVESSNSHNPDQFKQFVKRRIVAIVNYVSGALYNAAARNQSRNVAFAPMSFDTLLAVLYFGANPVVHRQLNSSLDFPAENSVGKAIFNQFIDDLNKLPKDKFKFITNIYTQKGQKLKTDFQEIAENDLESKEIESVNFNNPQDIIEKINNSTAENTERFVDDLIQANDLQDVLLLSVNVGDFNEEFLRTFSTSTEPKAFKTYRNSEERALYLHDSGEYNYGFIEPLGVPWLKIPFKNPALSLYCFVPQDNVTFESFEKKLGQIDILQLPSKIAPLEVELPFFNITSRLNLKSAVQEAGIGELLQNINNVYENVELVVDHELHEASVEVSHGGVKIIFGSQITTQARAANKTSNQSSKQVDRSKQLDKSPVDQSPVSDKRTRFFVDKPFFLVLVQESSGADIFYARVESVSNNIKSKNIKSKDIESNIIESNNIESQNIKSKDIESKNIKSNEIESQNIKSKDIELNNTQSKDIESKDIEPNNVESKNIESNNVESKNIISKDIKSNEIESQNIKSKDIELNNTQSKDIESNNIESKDIKSNNVESNNNAEKSSN